MIVWFVRHGESVATAMGDSAPIEHDLPLTEVGAQEALGVRDYFVSNNIAISRVYASTYQRAVQTAEPTAAQFGVTVTQTPDLCERHWGVLATLTWQELSSRLAGMSIEERYNFVPENGESWAQMEDRTQRALTQIMQGTGDVAVFTHGGVLRGILPALAGVNKEQHERFTMKTGGIAKYDSELKTVEILL